MEFSEEISSEYERRLKQNLATRIMSNGVGVVVKDHDLTASNGFMNVLSSSLRPTTVWNKQKVTMDSSEQRKKKKTFSSLLHPPDHSPINTTSHKALVSSSVATVLNHQHLTASFPLQQLLQHNYIIKTCLTTYTYLTTMIQNKKSAVSTFETVISVVTTESLTSMFPGNLIADIRPTKTKLMEVKTIQPTAHKDYISEYSDFVKLEKRIDNRPEDDLDSSYELIQPSEVSHHAPCTTTSCSCSHFKTESIEKVKSKFTNSLKHKNEATVLGPFKRITVKPTKLESTKLEQITPTRKQTTDKDEIYGPYKYETTKIPPSDKVVEKYTEVINDYSDEKGTSSIEESELLTNEKAPPAKNVKVNDDKKPEKNKEKPQKPNKTKLVVADLLKLGSLGIKGLSQLAPVIEKMTGGFIKRQDTTKTATTAVKPVTNLTPYNVNKRLDSNEVEKKIDTKQTNFPIYIPVDELETSESQHIYSNATLHQNLAWGADRKHPKVHFDFSKQVHESPLLNGGIPISPGEIITTNSDVIVGKPAVGGPLTLSASGIKLQSGSKITSLDSQAASNEPFLVNERPQRPYQSNNDDSYDLRPPELPNLRPRQPMKDLQRRPGSPQIVNYGSNQQHQNNQYHRLPTKNDQRHPLPQNELRVPLLQYDQRHTSTQNEQRVPLSQNDQRQPPHENDYSNPSLQYDLRTPTSQNDLSKLGATSQTSNTFSDHGRPALLDYIPAFSIPNDQAVHHSENHEISHNREHDGLEVAADSHPSSSEIINTSVKNSGEYSISSQLFSESISKPFLVDIQPSRVANVIIPHGSSTALIFAGSSEPHKTGDYIDDPLPYPEPGYFGSFSIDAPQMTMVHNVAPTPNVNRLNLKQKKPSQFDSTQSHSSPPKTISGFNNDHRNKPNKNTKRPTNNFSNLPPPTSNQETHIQVGPHIASYNPNVFNPSSQDFEKYNNLRDGGNKFQDSKKVIDKEYENHLAVPPPPPRKDYFSEDTNAGKKQETLKNARPYNQRPIFHTKPIQDMTVFLNVQHPVPKHPGVPNPNQESLPPKITSEIYFAAASPQNDPKTPTYTVHLPATTIQTPLNNEEQNYDSFNFNIRPQSTSSFQHYQNDFDVVTPKQAVTKSAIQLSSILNDNNNVYTVTLNTATNIGNSNVNHNKIHGTSIVVPVGASHNNFTSLDSAGIPVGTNVAIKVDGNPVSFQSFNLNSQNNAPMIFNDHSQAPDIIVGGNRWNFNPNENTDYETHTENHVTYNETLIAPNIYIKKPNKPPQKINIQIEPNGSFHNSHGNFPMIHDTTMEGPIEDLDVKPVTEYVEDIVKIDHKRPSKLIPNIPTNSHGWYSSIPINNMNINTFANVNKIKAESTTRKVIPLLHAYDKDSIPEFGEKIPSVGLPPTNLWNQNNVPALQGKDKRKFNVPTKDNVKPSDFMGPPPLTTQSYNPAYIPSNFGVSKQPAYDIPIRDDESFKYGTTKHPKQSVALENVKPVYENSEEIYDGGSDENISDEEVSLESMKIPVVSTSNEMKHHHTTPLILLQDEVFDSSEAYEKSQITITNSNTGTQTEKPFLGGEYNHNQTPSQFSTQRPAYKSNSHMKPRPFEVNSHIPSLSDIPNPHWQINQLLENMTTPEDKSNLILNIGEEITRPVTKKPVDFTTKKHHTQEIQKKPPRPIFSLKHDNTKTRNESSSIITATVHLSDFKPLTVYNDSKEDTSSTLPSFTIGSTHLEDDNPMTDILNLSPPPPTMDYNFKPSSTDDTIMGMIPPPARIPIVPRVPPIRTPAPSRTPPTRPTVPPRTPPPYRKKPVRTLPPRTQPPKTVPSRNSPLEQHNDEISTYRPSYDILKNKQKRPTFNRDKLPSHLVPPTEISPQFEPEPSNLPAHDFEEYSMSNIVFPTLISSGWLTSSSVDFPVEYSPSSVQFSFAPTKIYENTVVNKPVTYKPLYEQTPVLIPDEHMVIPIRFNDNKESTTTKMTNLATHEYTSDSNTTSDSVAYESNISQEEIPSSEETKVVPLHNKNKLIYKIQTDDNKRVPPKVRLPAKPSVVIRPTRILSRSDILYPTKVLPSRKRPTNLYSPSSRITTVYRPTALESSESPMEDDYSKYPTDVLKEIVSSSSISEKVIPLVEKTILPTPSRTIEVVSVTPTHHAGNEVKVSDEIVPTKTEFKTTAITLTKTLSEPPKTVSTTRFLNLTHTLTVTHTKTSLVSQSAGAMTQTLILTNTHTSTIVDVVTEIHTQVQPTTIVETVTKHIPIVQPTSVLEKPLRTQIPALDDISISSEEDNLIINPGNETENIQKVDKDDESDTFLIVMNKSQNGGTVQPVPTEIESSDYDGVTRNEEVNSNGVSQVLFGEILLAGTPYLETTNVVKPTGTGFSKECQPDCKASRNERCQRIEGIMKCVCRPGFARMFPDRPCKPTYTYSVKLALSHQGKEPLHYHPTLANNASKEYHSLALATHEGINRMVMQSDLRDVFHGIHINGFHPVEVPTPGGDKYTGADFYVQLSDNAHETRLKEVIEKYLRTNNYSLGGTEVYAAGELVDQLDVSDFDECHSVQFHDCSEHAQCFNLRGTYTCSCMEGFADMSVNALYPGRICSAEQVGCERCNYHGACYTRDDKRVLCECFQWYSGASCHINLKVILISLTTVGAALVLVLVVCGVMACSRRPRPRPAHPHPPPRSIVTSCIQNMPSLHQGAIPISKHRGTHDRRALINERTDSGDASSVQNMSLPYMPSKKVSAASNKGGKKCSIPDPPSEKAPAPCVMIPRARLHQGARDGREAAARKSSMELSSEAKLISYLESGSNSNDEMMRRKHSAESSYSLSKERHSKHNAAGALISAGFKVSTTVKADDSICKDDDMSSINKTELLDGNLSHFDTLRKSYSQDDISEWTDAERRIGELTLSEARSVGGTLPASTGRAASSTRLTRQEANTMAERDLGSTFLLPHVHLYKPELGSEVSEFDSL